MIRIFCKKRNYYSSKEYFSWYVAEQKENECVVVYSYDSLIIDDCKKINGFIVPEEKLKPYSFDFCPDISLDTINKYVIKNYPSTNCIYEIDLPIEDTNLVVPERYVEKEILFEEIFDDCITNEFKEKISKIKFDFPNVLCGYSYDEFLKTDISNSLDIHGKFFCTKCKKFYYPLKDNAENNYRIDICPYCKKRFFLHESDLILDDYNNYYKENFRRKLYGRDKIKHSKKFYIMVNKDNGIVVYKISRDIYSKNSVIYIKYTVDYSIEHIVGKSIVSYKHLKKGKKVCDSFEAFNINSKNICEVPTIIYEGADSFFEFASSNEKFLRMSGFQSVLKYSRGINNLEAFFIVFLAILNKYPVLEQIIKMGYAKLFFDLYNSMIKCENKNEINDLVNSISTLINKEATSGKDALRFPSYIGDYLLKKDACIEEYCYWRDIFEITKFSKEQFENFVESINYAWINSQVGLSDVCNILKYGYDINKMFNYVIKQQKNNGYSICDVFTYFNDYLEMCEFCEIKPDEYPQDIKKQHDDMLKYFKNRKKMEYDRIIYNIGLDCEKYVVPNEDEIERVGIPKAFKDYTVVFPKSEADFINEGNQQHNCVGSYPRSVKEGRCVIFFIRKKESPDKSFITAECTRNGLGQCFYSNNRHVYDEELRKFASYIANKIKTGCSSGKIRGLSNVPKI